MHAVIIACISGVGTTCPTRATTVRAMFGQSFAAIAIHICGTHGSAAVGIHTIVSTFETYESRCLRNRTKAIGQKIRFDFNVEHVVPLRQVEALAEVIAQPTKLHFAIAVYVDHSVCKGKSTALRWTQKSDDQEASREPPSQRPSFFDCSLEAGAIYVQCQWRNVSLASLYPVHATSYNGTRYARCAISHAIRRTATKNPHRFAAVNLMLQQKSFAMTIKILCSPQERFTSKFIRKPCMIHGSKLTHP